MLRFRRDRLYLGLEPDRLTLVRLSGAWSGFSLPRVMFSTIISFEESAPDSTRVEALRQELRAPQWQGAESHFVLSDRLVRYFVAERPPGARNVEEVQLAAGLRFEDVFGVPASEWTIQLDMPPFATHQLGCALRKTFVADLVAACSHAKSPAVSITPFAISEFNRAHSVIGDKSGWFSVFGRHSLWIGQKKGSDWLSAHQYTVTEDVAGDFSRLMAQECLRATSSSSTTSPMIWLSGLLGNSATRQKLASSPALLLGASGWSGESEEWNASYRLALSPEWPACV